jgi:hypothetical protein
MVKCTNGHENPADQNFCGECGVSLVPGMVICPHGHVNPEDFNFCAHCGVPIAVPVAVDSEASKGHWAVDPTCHHQYRFWDGSSWTEYVADNGLFSSDPFRPTGRRYRHLVGIAAALVAGILVVGAISTAVIQFSRFDERKVAQSQSPLPPLNVSPPSAAAPASFPPTAPAALPLAAIGASCPPGSINGITAEASVAYCELLPDTGTFMWSLYPGDIESPYPAGTDPGKREDPAIAVCMDQTPKSRAECDALLGPQGNSSGGE